MDDNRLTITFLPTDVEIAIAHYDRLSAIAAELGRGSATWKVTEGWFSLNLTTKEAMNRLQLAAVPLPRGWTMRAGDVPA